MVKDVELIGGRVLLRPISGGDAPLIVKWRNDPRVGSQLFNGAELTLQGHMDWFENVYPKDGGRLDFIIIETQGGRAIGTAGLKGLDGAVPEVSYAIGEEDMLKKGYASDAVKTLLAYAKSEGYGAAKALVKEDNAASRRFLEKMGFHGQGPPEGGKGVLEYRVNI